MISFRVSRISNFAFLFHIQVLWHNGALIVRLNLSGFTCAWLLRIDGSLDEMII